MKHYQDLKYCPACGSGRVSGEFVIQYVSENKCIFVKCPCGCSWLELSKNNKEDN